MASTFKPNPFKNFKPEQARNCPACQTACIPMLSSKGTWYWQCGSRAAKQGCEGGYYGPAPEKRFESQPQAQPQEPPAKRQKTEESSEAIEALKQLMEERFELLTEHLMRQETDLKLIKGQVLQIPKTRSAPQTDYPPPEAPTTTVIGALKKSRAPPPTLHKSQKIAQVDEVINEEQTQAPEESQME